jgi:hypothetical protein
MRVGLVRERRVAEVGVGAGAALADGAGAGACVGFGVGAGVALGAGVVAIDGVVGGDSTFFAASFCVPGMAQL